jgi:hypothetical protein
MSEIEPEVGRVGCRWGRETNAHAYLDGFLLHSAAPFKIWADFFPKTLNLLIFLAASGSENPGFGHD